MQNRSEREKQKIEKREKAAAKAAKKKKRRIPTKSSNTISPMPSPTRKKSTRDTCLQSEVHLAVQYTVLKGKVMTDISRLPRQIQQQLEETKINVASTQDHVHYNRNGQAGQFFIGDGIFIPGDLKNGLI